MSVITPCPVSALEGIFNLKDKGFLGSSFLRLLVISLSLVVVGDDLLRIVYKIERRDSDYLS